MALQTFIIIYQKKYREILKSAVINFLLLNLNAFSVWKPGRGQEELLKHLKEQDRTSETSESSRDSTFDLSCSANKQLVMNKQIP